MECVSWGLLATLIGIFVVIIGTGIAVATFMNILFRNFKTDINARIDRLDADVRAQTARTDQLYMMFIDLLKSQNPKTNP